MRVLVTGGAGFIGSHLVQALATRGVKVRVLDNLSSGSLENLANVTHEFVLGDIVDAGLMNEAAAGCDVVYHQAALVSVPQSIENPRLAFESNVLGMFNLLEAARLNDVRRFVYASSSAVYGNLPGLPKHEDDRLSPISPYAATKQAGEVMAAAYAAAFGLELVGLRYMNVFGPRQDPSSPYSGVLSIFCQAAIRGEGCTIYGDGEQTRDFVFVRDVVEANMLAGTVPMAAGSPAQVINVGQGEQTSLNQILEILQELTGRPIPITYAPERRGDIKHSVADIGRARSVLRYAPRTRVVDGISQTLDWFRSQQGDAARG